MAEDDLERLLRWYLDLEAAPTSVGAGDSIQAAYDRGHDALAVGPDYDDADDWPIENDPRRPGASKRPTFSRRSNRVRARKETNVETHVVLSAVALVAASLTAHRQGNAALVRSPSCLI